ncbi:type II toxin-antitoxin system VapB family antitoxin [Moorena producens]|uniref:type II toxin-antitoxin system VapB family antitoxin n=1 Tax=Moorena producens TaxID=1155739 RepID=UPI003C778150
MNTELALWKVVISLPEHLKTELLHYADYLRENYPNNTQSDHEKIGTTHGYGSWAGQIIMSDDFDEPLEDLAEYM